MNPCSDLTGAPIVRDRIGLERASAITAAAVNAELASWDPDGTLQLGDALAAMLAVKGMGSMAEISPRVADAVESFIIA